MARAGQIPKVEKLRNPAGITQQGLAGAIGITDHTYRNWIKGRTKPTLQIEQVKLLCSLLKCSLDDLPDDFSLPDTSED